MSSNFASANVDETNRTTQTKVSNEVNQLPESSLKDLSGNFLSSESGKKVQKYFEKFGLYIYGEYISPLFERSVGMDLPVAEDNTIEFIFSTEEYLPNLATNLEFFDLQVTREIPQLNMVTVKGYINDINKFFLQKAVSFNIRYAEPNLRVSLLGEEEVKSPEIKALGIPTDPLYSEQYGHEKINAPQAWDQITDLAAGQNVLVAVIDTGIDYTHPDIVDSYVPLGYNWVFDNNDPMDDHSHGTHVAGIIAAGINNSIGVAGVAPVKVMAEKFLDSNGFGDLDDGALAIVHAVDAGADILSNSWGAGFEVESVSDAIDYATANGVTFIAAAGNRFGPDANFNYPAAHPSAISVSSTNAADTLSSFSSYGSSVDVSAPGSNILSTILGGQYEYFSGTSMATPHVSAVAALMLMQQPDLSPQEIRTLLHESGVDLGDPYFDQKFGYGRIDAEQAVLNAKRSTNDLLASIYVPTAPMGKSKPMEFGMAIHNFGTTAMSSVDVNVYQNNVVIASYNYPSIAAKSVIKENVTIITTLSGQYNITLEIVPDAGETNLSNNVDTEIIDLGRSTYQYQEVGFNWTDATKTGYNTGLDADDGYITLELPFTFTYYNADFERVFISSNGWLSFVNTQPFSFWPIPFPNDADPFSINPLRNDLIVSSFDPLNGSLWVIEAPEHVIIQYENVDYYWGNKVGSFQVVLYDNGDIQFNYLDVNVDQSTVIGLNKGLASGDATEITHNPPNKFIQRSFLFSDTITNVANEVGVLVNDPPTYVLPNSMRNLELLVLNYGTQGVTSLPVNLTINGVSVLSQTVDLSPGSGIALTYDWSPTLEGIYTIEFSAGTWLNETNLANNVFSFNVTVLTSRLSVPYNVPVEYYTGTFDDPYQAFGWMVLPSDDPELAILDIYIRDRFDNSTFEFFLEFNVITFEDQNGQRPLYLLPNDADVGFQDQNGEITGIETITVQGVSLSAYVYDVFGDRIYYDVNTKIMVAWGYFDTFNGTFSPYYQYEYSEVLDLGHINQKILMKVQNANLGGAASLELYVRNTGSTASGSTSIDIHFDGVLDNQINVVGLDPGEELRLNSSVPINDELEHLVESVLLTLVGETFVEDNTAEGVVKAVIAVAIFQDWFPFGSDIMEFMLRDFGFEPIYFSSFDIGTADLSGYERIIIASDQSSDFETAVSNNVVWFESYVELGATLEIHAASNSDAYTVLPGGATIFQDGSTYADQISILEPNNPLFTGPNQITEDTLNFWGWSAHGYLQNLPDNALELAAYAIEEIQTVLAIAPIGQGDIIYTVQPVECWCANWSFLENLLQYTPTYPIPTPPVVDGIGEIEVVEGSDSELIWHLFSDKPQSYEIRIDGSITRSDGWLESSMIVRLDVSTMDVGTYRITVNGMDQDGLSGSYTTVLTVTTLVVETSETSSITSSETSKNNDSPLAFPAMIIGLVIISSISILRKRRE